MSDTKSKLGILAGGGPLPRRVAQSAQDSGRPVFIVAFDGQTDSATVEGLPHAWLRLGGVGKIFSSLHAQEVRDLCMIGRFRRPSLRELMPDLQGSKLAMKIGFGAAGDDTLMRGISDALAEEGFRVVGAHEVMQGLLAEPGVLTRRAPDDLDREDIARGLEVARTIGTLDVGQGAVVQRGIVLSVEAAEGTDAMLARTAAVLREGGGGVLVKASKPQQDRRFDLPVVGVATVEAAAAAGLVGIAVEAGATLIDDARAVTEAADRLGLFVVAVEIPA